MTEATKTPWHLWVIGIVALLWNGFGAFDFTATSLRVEPYIAQFPPAMMDYIQALPLWMWVGWALGTVGGFIGSVLLLMRNKLAAWAYALSLIGAGASNGSTLINPPPPEIGANAGLTIFILVVAAGLLAYSFWLSRRGILR